MCERKEGRDNSHIAGSENCLEIREEVHIPRKRSNDWRNNELASLGSTCHSATKAAQRALGRIGEMQKKRAYREARENRKLAIQRC